MYLLELEHKKTCQSWIFFFKEFELSKAEKRVDVNKVKQEIESLFKEKSKLDANISELRFVATLIWV